jgi:putative ABC transport system permease protein
MKIGSIAERIYRLLLFLYPPEFRGEYGAAMVEAFTDRWKQERAKRRGWPGFRVWPFVLRDLASSAVDQWRAREPGASASRPSMTPSHQPGKARGLVDVVCDVRHALRGFARSPGFTALAILTAAVGIGANAAVFSVVASVVLHPLPFHEPHRLVFLRESWSDGGTGPLAYPNVLDWREQNQVFDYMVAYEEASANLQDADAPLRVRSVNAEADFFAMLGVKPLLGRTFLPGEDQSNQPPVVVLSEGLWKRRYGANPALLGRTIPLNGVSHTVIGIMPADFRFPAGSPSADLWLTLRLPPNQAQNRASHFLGVVARLAPGVDLAAAESQMNDIAHRLAQQYPEEQGGGGAWARPLHEVVVGRIQPLLFVLFGAVGFVLLIACANLGNMLLARAANRSHEVAVRSALGAGRGRLVRQFLTESVLLSCAGGLIGVLLAHWGVDVLVALGGSQIPRSSEIRIDGGVLVFLMTVASLAGIGFGLTPALLAAKTDLLGGLGTGSGRIRDSKKRRKVRNLLVVGELALAFVLLMGAGLLVQTLIHLKNTDPGMVTENVLTMRMSLPAHKYSGATATDFYRDVVEHVETLPGVSAVGLNSRLPLDGYALSGRFAIQGRPWGPPGTEPHAQMRLVSAGYFNVLGIPVVRGRDFSKHDDAETEPVAIINETLARRYYPNEDPVGKLIQTPTCPELFLRPKERRMTIVGIVADVKDERLHHPPQPVLYFPYRQIQQFDELANMSLAVRAQVPAENLTGAIRSAVRSVDPGQPVYSIKTMDQIVSDSLSTSRFTSWLFGSFAAIALVLAVAGIYGVVSYLVAQRTKEFGVRTALGARPIDVLGDVLSKGMLLVGAGIVLGVAGALAVTRILGGLLFGVTPTDVPTYIAVSVLLAAVALAACAFPARRAMRVDPIETLRYE